MIEEIQLIFNEAVNASAVECLDLGKSLFRKVVKFCYERPVKN